MHRDTEWIGSGRERAVRYLYLRSSVARRSGRVNEPMSSDTPDRGYGLLSSLRNLEKRLRRLRSTWKSFRDDPSPEALAALQVQADSVSADIRQLSRGLAASFKSCDTNELTSIHRAARPAARDVVTASREVDGLIWDGARCWKEVIESPGIPLLKRLEEILVSSAERAGTLLEALGGTGRRAGTIRAPGISRGGSTADRIEARSREIESLIWRIQSDWHHVRRAPTVERIGLLQDELREAAACARELRLDVGSGGTTELRRALRLGIHGADAVRFLPFRDPFTGVYNRQGFDALAGAELKRCRRYGRRFGLLVLHIAPSDLDQLRQLVAAARGELREYDLVGRYVEDQLVIGIPEGGRGATRRVASRVLKEMRRPGGGRPVAGLGYATLPEDGATLSGLYETALRRAGLHDGETSGNLERGQAPTTRSRN